MEVAGEEGGGGRVHEEKKLHRSLEGSHGVRCQARRQLASVLDVDEHVRRRSKTMCSPSTTMAGTISSSYVDGDEHSKKRAAADTRGLV